MYDQHCYLLFSVRNTANAAYETHKAAPRITVKGNQVHVNGTPIPPSATKVSRQQIYWRHHHQGGFSYGYLNFPPHGMFFHGMLATGASPSTARLMAVQGAVEPSTYSTTISPKPSYDPNTKKCTVKEDETFIRGLQVEIGYTWDAQTGVPKQIFKVDGKDLHDNLRMDSTTHFIVDKDMVTSMYAKENNCFPVAAQFTMAADSHSFTGSITLIRDGKETENFCWNGTSTTKKQSFEDTDAAMALDDEPRSFPEPAAFHW